MQVVAKYAVKFGMGLLCASDKFKYVLPLVIPLLPIPIHIFVFLIIFLIVRFTPKSVVNSPEENGIRKEKSSWRSFWWSVLLYLFIAITVYYIAAFTLCDVVFKKDTQLVGTIVNAPETMGKVRDQFMNVFKKFT